MKLISIFLLIFSALTIQAQCLPTAIQGEGNLSHKKLNMTSAPYGYVEYLPPAYTSQKKKWPLLLMLHGVGESGDGQSDLRALYHHGPLKRIIEGREFPAVILTLQTNGRWNSQLLMEFFEFAFNHYSIDRSRVYMTGLSMGGGGTWEFVRTYPNVLAAALPVCGAAKTNFSPEEADALKNTAIYAVHNADDDVVPLSSTIGFAETFGRYQNAQEEFLDGYQNEKDMTASFNLVSKKWDWSAMSRGIKKGSKFTIAIDRKGGHDSWSKTYESEATWEWLFCQSISN